MQKKGKNAKKGRNAKKCMFNYTTHSKKITI